MPSSELIKPGMPACQVEKARPPSTRWKVSQLGTFNFNPSMIAASIKIIDTSHITSCGTFGMELGLQEREIDESKCDDASKRRDAKTRKWRGLSIGSKPRHESATNQSRVAAHYTRTRKDGARVN